MTGVFDFAENAPTIRHVTPELELAQDAWQDAIERRDVAAAEALLHDEYSMVLVHPRPTLVPRKRWLEMLPDYVVHEYAIHNRHTDLDGDTAAILQQIYQRATVLGEDRSGMFIITDLWRKVEGEWQVWKRHSTPLADVVLPAQ